ncbi:MAG: hypothetical protein ACOC6Q_01835 [Patescibacteria group bacterium]
MINLLTLAAYAQDVSPVGEEVTPFPDLGALLASGIQIAMLVAGIIVLFIIILGGIQYVTSGGDKEAAAAARDKITAALVGLLIIVSAYAIAAILEKVLGIRIISGINFPAAPNIVGD